MCVDRLTTHTVNIGNTRESRFNLHSDRTTEDCETVLDSRRHAPTYNGDASFRVPDSTSIRHADRSHYGRRYIESLTVEGAALRSSLRRNVSANWKASATTATSATESKVVRKRRTSGPDTEPRRFRQVDGNHNVATLAAACFRCRYCSAAGIRFKCWTEEFTVLFLDYINWNSLYCTVKVLFTTSWDPLILLLLDERIIHFIISTFHVFVITNCVTMCIVSHYRAKDSG